MDGLLILTILIIFFTLAFAFINGFHDTANAIATSVSTKALRPRKAILLASAMNFIGAMAFTGVARTITENIVDPFTLPNGTFVILAALIAAISWNLITWYFGIPSSSSHAIIGAIAGAAISATGFSTLNYNGFIKILEALFFSPIIAFLLGYIVYTIFKLLFSNNNLTKMNKGFRFTQIITASLQAFTHGANDAQKAMGIITMALIANDNLSSIEIPFWVQLSCAIAMSLGTSVGGWKIIKTISGNIIKIRPSNGVAADLSSAMIIFGATFIGLPVSTTHVISTSIIGVGTSHRAKGVKWRTSQRMIITWIITIPISASLAGIIYYLLKFIY